MDQGRQVAHGYRATATGRHHAGMLLSGIPRMTPEVARIFALLPRRIHERGLAFDGSVPLPLTQEEIADCTA
jgi:hypothetical protein